MENEYCRIEAMKMAIRLKKEFTDIDEDLFSLSERVYNYIIMNPFHNECSGDDQ